MPLIEAVEVVALARPGEPIHVQVLLTRAAPADTQVTISGLQARDVWLQAPGRLGEWRILVYAVAGVQAERQVATVTVAGTPIAPVLEIARNPFEELGVIFHVADLDPSHPLLGQDDQYRWRVGGAEIFTNVPLLAHDLTHLVNHQQPWTSALIQVTVEHKDKSQNLAKRTIVLGSWYRMLRDELKQVRPPVLTNGRIEQGRFSDPVYYGRMRITNLEPVAIRFTLRRFEWMVTDDELASYAPSEQIDIRLEPHDSLYLDVKIDRGEAAEGAHGVTVHMFGQSDDGMPVHTSASFDFVRVLPKIELPLPPQPIIPEYT